MGWNIEDNEGIFREKESFERRDRAVRELLRVDRSFDLIRRPVRIGGKKACWYTVDGLLNGELMEKVMDFYLGITPEDMPGDMQGFMEAQMPYVDAAVAEDVNALIQAFFSGNSCLLIDGYAQILTMDLRDYPARSIQEPIKDKVLQGSRDGLTETIMANIALIRRRIRDPELTFELANVGMSSRTDVAVVYIIGMAWFWAVKAFYMNDPIGMWTLFVTCFVPTIGVDVLKVFVAALLAARLEPALGLYRKTAQAAE